MFMATFSREMLRRLFGDKEPRDLRAMESAFKTVANNDNAIETALDGDNTTANGTQQAKADYIDFDLNAPVLEQPGRLHYNVTDDTLNIGHKDGVVQQVGQEQYAHVINNTGSTVENGIAVGTNGVSSEGKKQIKKYIADSTLDANTFLGLATHDLSNGEEGMITTFGLVRDINTTGSPYSQTWSAGDNVYVDPDTAGNLTNVKPTAPDLVIDVGIVLTVDATNGQIFVKPLVVMQKLYGEFVRTTNATAQSANTAYAIGPNGISNAHGISLTNTSRIVVEESGLYEISVNAQVKSNSASGKTIHLWFRKNGVNLANTSTYFTLDSNNSYGSIYKSDFFSLAANDYLEVMYAVDDVNIILSATAATAYSPASSSALITVTQVQQ